MVKGIKINLNMWGILNNKCIFQMFVKGIGLIIAIVMLCYCYVCYWHDGTEQLKEL